MAVVINKFAQGLQKQKHRADTFAKDLVSRCDKYLKKLTKLHEDLYIEFDENVNTVLTFIHQYAPCKEFLQEKPLPRRFND
jgi:hypothetical protein